MSKQQDTAQPETTETMMVAVKDALKQHRRAKQDLDSLTVSVRAAERVEARAQDDLEKARANLHAAIDAAIDNETT